jgi:site-specific DNA-cytosine methylase
MYFRAFSDAPLVQCNAPKVMKQMPSIVKLKTLDLFAGCGGLACGLEASGLAQCKWAVEWDEKAAESFSINFPECKVFNEDVREWFRKLQVRNKCFHGILLL